LSRAHFSVLECLQNIGKYAHASRATIVLEASDDELRFTVRDDGRGFDASPTGYGTGLQGIADRLAALNGSVQIESSPGAGTTIVGALPLPRREGIHRRRCQ
jgi:signal transduction histidine kinase